MSIWPKVWNALGDAADYANQGAENDLRIAGDLFAKGNNAALSSLFGWNPHLQYRFEPTPKQQQNAKGWDFAADLKRANLNAFLSSATTRAKALAWEKAYEATLAPKPTPAAARVPTSAALPGGAPPSSGAIPDGGGAGGAGGVAGAAPGGSFDVTSYLNSIMAGLPAKAHAAALADVNARVGAVRAWQQMLLDQAHGRANQIGLASQAAAALLKPIAGQTTDAYRNAAKDQVAFAGGYQGLLGDQATAAAQKVAGDLGAIGAPANTRTLDGIDTAAQPQSLGNILYSLGGALPASNLEQSGLAAGAYQRQLPAAQIGAGKAEQLAALGAGSTAANNLLPQILSAESELPHIADQYLTSYQQSAQQQALLPALLAGKWDAIPLAKSPVTGQPTSAYAKLSNDHTRLEIAMNNSNTSYDRYVATKAYQEGTLALRAAGLKTTALKKATTDSAKAAAWVQNQVQGYTKGSGANAVSIPPNADFAQLVKYVSASWPSLAGKPALAIVSTMLSPPLTAAQTGLPG